MYPMEYNLLYAIVSYNMIVLHPNPTYNIVTILVPLGVFWEMRSSFYENALPIGSLLYNSTSVQ